MSDLERKVSYRVFWDEPSAEWVGTCEQFGPMLSHLAPTPSEALEGIRDLTRDCVRDLVREGRPMPWEVKP